MDCILTYLNIVIVIIIIIEICAIKCFLFQVCVYLKKVVKYHYLIVLYYFILLPENYFCTGKYKGIEALYIMYIIHLCQECLKLW